MPVLRKERNVSCSDYFEGRRLYERNLGEVVLYECTVCGFAAFEELCHWSEDQFKSEIYNADYYLCDPPFGDVRPRKLSAWLSCVLAPGDLIDFGGGEGVLSALLNERGFHSQSYDPFYGNVQFPMDKADVVTAFEVVEHVPNQHALFHQMLNILKPHGLIIFSTLLKPTQLAQDWWYASPRNGHVSFHSVPSLGSLMRYLGLSHISLSSEIHVAARELSLLDDAAKWLPISINDTPEYFFDKDWSRLAKRP